MFKNHKKLIISIACITLVLIVAIITLATKSCNRDTGKSITGNDEAIKEVSCPPLKETSFPFLEDDGNISAPPSSETNTYQPATETMAIGTVAEDMATPMPSSLNNTTPEASDVVLNQDNEKDLSEKNTPEIKDTEKPAATFTPKPTAKITEKPTSTPTAKPTATPTATPTASPLPWTDEVVDYLTDESRGSKIISSYRERIVPAGIAKGTEKNPRCPEAVVGTVFGECACNPDYNRGVCTHVYKCVENVNSGGLISKVVSKKGTTEGIYIDGNNVVDGELTEFQLIGETYYILEENVAYTIHEENVFGTKVSWMTSTGCTIRINHYPLKDGNYVVDLGGFPVIINMIPDSIEIRFKAAQGDGWKGLQVLVNGHIAYEIDKLGGASNLQFW